MTCALITPWWRRRCDDVGASASLGSVTPTAILDWHSPAIEGLLAETFVGLPPGADRRELVQQAHGVVAVAVRPVYAVDERQPASRTVELGRGSCSQRMAVLEALARAAGVSTRVRGLLVDGKFWYPRFPRLQCLVPGSVLIAWPEFWLEDRWIAVSELFGEVGSDSGAVAFTNSADETLFDAVARTAVDWDGASNAPGACSACDLSAAVLRDLGHFDSRDELFERHGQTLCGPARLLVGPFLSRRRATAPARG